MIAKNFIAWVSLEEKIAEDLRKLVDKFAFSYAFYRKYENLWSQIFPKDM